jgi:hypothetical protein
MHVHTNMHTFHIPPNVSCRINTFTHEPILKHTETHACQSKTACVHIASQAPTWRPGTSSPGCRARGSTRTGPARSSLWSGSTGNAARALDSGKPFPAVRSVKTVGAGHSGRSARSRNFVIPGILRVPGVCTRCVCVSAWFLMKRNQYVLFLDGKNCLYDDRSACVCMYVCMQAHGVFLE